MKTTHIDYWDFFTKNTIQIYEYSNPIELLTGIASMTEQLISKNVIDENQIKTAIEMGARRAKWKSLDL